MNNPALNICLDEPAWAEALPEIETIAARVAQAVFATAAAAGEIDFLRSEHIFTANLSLNNDAEIQRLNLEFRQIDKPTNVLSFAAVDDPDFERQLAGSNPVELGDMMIALETMQREAAEQNISLHDHFCHLLAHGLLHLLGFDHQEETEAAEMERLEIAVLRSLNIDNPYKEL